MRILFRNSISHPLLATFLAGIAVTASLVLAFVLHVHAQAQPPVAGSIDGVPLGAEYASYPRDKAVNYLKRTGKPQPTEDEVQAFIESQVCNRLVGAIDRAATQKKLRDFGLTVTEADRRAERAKLDPQLPERARANANVDRIIENHKVELEVVRHLRLADPRFAAETARMTLDQIQGALFLPTDSYVKTALLNYWREERAKLNVQLNDSSLKAKCGLAQMGVQ